MATTTKTKAVARRGRFSELKMMLEASACRLPAKFTSDARRTNRRRPEGATDRAESSGSTQADRLW